MTKTPLLDDLKRIGDRVRKTLSDVEKEAVELASRTADTRTLYKHLELIVDKMLAGDESETLKRELNVYLSAIQRLDTYFKMMRSLPSETRAQLLKELDADKPKKP